MSSLEVSADDLVASERRDERLVRRVMVSCDLVRGALRGRCARVRPSSLNVRSSRSSRLPRRLPLAWALNRSKNLPSRASGVRALLFLYPRRAILAFSLRRCRIPSRRAPLSAAFAALGARRAAFGVREKRGRVAAARRRRRYVLFSKCSGDGGAPPTATPGKQASTPRRPGTNFIASFV